jgi:hypothetical protein
LRQETDPNRAEEGAEARLADDDVHLFFDHVIITLPCWSVGIQSEIGACCFFNIQGPAPFNDPALQYLVKTKG